jgi:hypothetical protein
MNPQILNSVYGYYQVGNQHYLNKTEAVYNATKNNQPLKWYFHEEVFGKINWSQRPAGTLEDLYRERAQQIRDNYDHVIVMFSGGMDSWTVLHSFLSNNIHIDEVYTSWPRAERKFKKLSKDLDQSNIGSEYEFAVMPVLKHIEKNYPNTNIFMNDFSDDLQSELTEADFLKINNYQNMPSFFKYSKYTEKELEALKQNKRVAIVTGAEKTHVAVENGNFYAFFTDQSNGSDSVGRNIEFFYWSPEFPLIPVLQAHCLKDFLKDDLKANPTKIPGRDNFKYTYQQVCYPEYNIETFQAKKQFGTLYWPSDAWIKEYNPTYYKSWQWVTGQYFNDIDSVYLATNKADDVIGIKLLNSPYYLIEPNTDLPDFKC